MADGYVSMLQLCGMAMMVAIRAALIPSSPRRTIIVTALFGVPMILVTTVLVPVADGGLAWRALDSGAYPWLPASLRHDVGLRHHHVHRHLVGHLRPPGRGPRGPPARPVRARTEDWRRGNGGGLSGPPRHDAAPLGDQAAAGRSGRRDQPRSFRARSPADRASHPPQHHHHLRLWANPRRRLLLRDGAPRRRDPAADRCGRRRAAGRQSGADPDDGVWSADRSPCHRPDPSRHQAGQHHAVHARRRA